jgi:5-methylcytosine-specific restriction protein A
MPTAPLRPCAAPQCPARVPRGYCPEHARRRERERGSAHARGYTSAWSRYARGFRARHPLCGDKEPDAYPSTASRCALAGRVTVAEVVHHIRAHQQDQALFWDRRNHESACKACHDAVVNEGDFGR